MSGHINFRIFIFKITKRLDAWEMGRCDGARKAFPVAPKQPCDSCHGLKHPGPCLALRSVYSSQYILGGCGWLVGLVGQAVEVTSRRLSRIRAAEKFLQGPSYYSYSKDVIPDCWNGAPEPATETLFLDSPESPNMLTRLGRRAA